jgi:hypothetical protein
MSGPRRGIFWVKEGLLGPWRGVLGVALGMPVPARAVLPIQLGMHLPRHGIVGLSMGRLPPRCRWPGPRPPPIQPTRCLVATRPAEVGQPPTAHFQFPPSWAIPSRSKYPVFAPFFVKKLTCFCPLVHPDCHFVLQDCPLVHWFSAAFFSTLPLLHQFH